MDEVERARSSEVARDGARFAPEEYARAERERALSRQAHAAGDDVAANLHAEHALAAYQHAAVVARLSRAASEQSEAQTLLDQATAQLASINAERAKLEHEADDLDQRARAVRERLIPATSASTTAEREAARTTAARSLVAGARLLCGAARLMKPDADGLAAATSDISVLEGRLEGSPARSTPGALAAGAVSSSSPPPLLPIDDAARARARCLELLASARRDRDRVVDGASGADGLLAELSASGGWDPVRDERGVVVTLWGGYRGTDLVEPAATKLTALGRIASAHPAFALQVVVHDATPAARGGSGDLDARRGEVAVQALVAGGASPSRIDVEAAGTHLPIADPSDARQRLRNDRLEVVFVGP
ncbi:MAG TPA: hypothetical protein VEK07_07505 [Polyangiaceae bacterium]|nr:hypothetical protein [Polyangiaceae bacterium]